MDFHTHNLQAPPGTAIVCLPLEVLRQPTLFQPVKGGLYSVGIHPWWTAEANVEALLTPLQQLLKHPQVVALGECGLDRLRGGDIDFQMDIFHQQIVLSETLSKPVIIHCVRAFDILLRLKKQWHPTQQWTVHGFRGRPALAQQLLDAGFDLSFGPKRNDASYYLTPPDRRHDETDDTGLPLATSSQGV